MGQTGCEAVSSLAPMRGNCAMLTKIVQERFRRRGLMLTWMADFATVCRPRIISPLCRRLPGYDPLKQRLPRLGLEIDGSSDRLWNRVCSVGRRDGILLVGFAGIRYRGIPALVDEVTPVASRNTVGKGGKPKKGLFGEVVSGDTCCDAPGGCSQCAIGKACQHSHQCDDCVFCKARAKRAAQAATSPFVPIHQRPDYQPQPPDILLVNVVELDPAAKEKECNPFRASTW